MIVTETIIIFYSSVITEYEEPHVWAVSQAPPQLEAEMEQCPAYGIMRK